MRSLRRLLVGAAVAIAASASVFVLGAPAAHAYGNNHVYELTFSLNCDAKNSPLCAPTNFGLGGAWGWIEPDTDGADATVTFCGHSQGFNGAQHQNLSGVPWSIASSSAIPAGVFVVGTDPGDQYIVFPNSPLGFIAFPVTANHYSTSFGPGITAQATVVVLH